jgi:hypothetical protein
MKQGVTELMTAVAEIKDQQTGQIVELAIAFGLTRMMAERENALSVVYKTHDIVEFLQNYRVSADVIDDSMTQLTITRKGAVDAA